jgi:hypothetical protein
VTLCATNKERIILDMIKLLNRIHNFFTEADYNDGKNCSTCVNFDTCQFMECNWNPNEHTLKKIKDYSNSLKPLVNEMHKNGCECCWKDDNTIIEFNENETSIKICNECFNKILLQVTKK